MPSQMVVIKRNPDGTLDMSSKVVTPFDDFGFGSVAAEKEQKRLEALGFDVRIIREKHSIVTEGGGN